MTVRPAEGERITVTLIPEVQEDLRRLQARTNLSKTDLANRAITLYEFFDFQQRAGRNVISQDPKTGMTEMVLVQLLAPTEGQALPDGSAAARSHPAHPHRARPHSRLVAFSDLARRVLFGPTWPAHDQKLGEIRGREVLS